MNQMHTDPYIASVSHFHHSSIFLLFPSFLSSFLTLLCFFPLFPFVFYAFPSHLFYCLFYSFSHVTHFFCYLLSSLFSISIFNFLSSLFPIAIQCSEVSYFHCTIWELNTYIPDVNQNQQVNTGTDWFRYNVYSRLLYQSTHSWANNSPTVIALLSLWSIYFISSTNPRQTVADYEFAPVIDIANNPNFPLP